MQGIEPRAAAPILASHLPDHYFGIRKHVKRPSPKPQGALQCLQQRQVLGDVIVLMSDPFGDPDGAVCGAVNYHPNTRRAGIPERAAIDVGYEI